LRQVNAAAVNFNEMCSDNRQRRKGYPDA
jgi:hypothetical protein